MGWEPDMAVRRFETILVMLPIIIGGAFVGYAISTVVRDYRSENAPAWKAGFANADEMDIAKKAGFSDPSLWHAELVRREALRDAQLAKIKAAQDEMKARDEAEKVASNAKFQVAIRGAIALRETMKNPDSFKLEQVMELPDGSLCYTYRAANSFNAIIPGQASYSPLKTAVSGSSAFPMLWSNKCKGYGAEIKNVAYALTNYYPRK